MVFPSEIFLIGKDTSASLSKPIQEAVFKYLGLNINYVTKNFNNCLELQAFLDLKITAGNFISNVTVPYKKYCMEYLTNTDFSKDKSCYKLNGCNLIISKANKVYNFDGLGFIKFLNFANIDVDNKDVLICGTGATSQAIVENLKVLSPNSIVFASRNKSDFALSYDEVNAKLNCFDVVVDTTPIEAENNLLYDVEKINNSAVVIDISYSYADTPLINRVKNVGGIAIDGKCMLVCQAILCIQEICNVYNFNSKKLRDFDKLYNIGTKAIGL